MARTGLWRLNIDGAAELQKRYQQGRWASVAAFCESVGISRTTYYELIRRDRWFEQETLTTTLAAIGIPTADVPRLSEYKGQEQESAPPLPILPKKLPRASTSFIGREQDIAYVQGLLRNATLLTLTGAGGNGKTRLALQVANDLYDSFPDGVWLVELSSVSDPDLVPQAVATVFSIREQVGISLVETLAKSLSSRSLLIVLDNCEHLIHATADLVSALVHDCPYIRILATSRHRLGISGEQIYSVPTLALPEPGLTITVEGVAAVESVRLFVERARLYRPSFVLNSQNVVAVASLCNRLDGIPLALELAAAQVRSLSIQDILVRLEGRFDLLKGGDRTDIPRQRSLRTLIDWSYDLLSAPERLLMQRLSVFPGGWTLTAAEAIGAGAPLTEGDVLDLQTALVDKSLVLAEERDGSIRYRMYDTLRHYATEKLESSGETYAVLARRQAWYMQFVRAAEQGIRLGEEHEKCVRSLETEHDNLRSTLAWDGIDAGDAQAGMHIAAALWRFWMISGFSREGYEHLRRALGRANAHEKTDVRSSALAAAGNLANNLGDYDAAINLYLQSVSIRKDLAKLSDEWTHKGYIAALLLGTAEVATTKGDLTLARDLFMQSHAVHLEILQLHRASGDKQHIATALIGLGRIAAELGDYAAAKALLEECLALRRELKDKRNISLALYDMSFAAQKEGDFERVRTLYEECLGIRRELGDRRGVALAYYELGDAAWRQGDFAAALGNFEAGLKQFTELGGDRQYCAMCLEGSAGAQLRMGHARQAVLLWAKASVLRETTGTPIDLDKRTEHEGHLAQARKELGDTEFDRNWLEGRATPHR